MESKALRWLIMGVATLVFIPCFFAVPIAGFVFGETFSVPTTSMAPTVLFGDTISTSKKVPEERPARAGDIVVFWFPQRAAKMHLEEQPPSQRACVDSETLNGRIKRFVMRVVAVGGQTVEMRDNQLYVDGEPVEQEVLSKEASGSHLYPQTIRARETIDGRSYEVQFSNRSPDFGPVKVPDDEVFVMGDNRDYASDSRCWGTVARVLIRNLATRVVVSEDPEGGIRWSRFGESLEPAPVSK